MSQSGSRPLATTGLGRAGKFGACSVALGVGLGVAGESQAGIMQFVPDGGPITLTGGSLEIDLNDDGHPDFLLDTVLQNYHDAVFQITGLITDGFENLIDFVLHNYAGAKLRSTIGPTDDLWQKVRELYDPNMAGGELDGQQKVIGLFFEIPGGSSHYGGLVVEGMGSSLIIHGGFFETRADTPIEGVPEPGSLALLALGAAGLVAWRLKKGVAA